MDLTSIYDFYSASNVVVCNLVNVVYNHVVYNLVMFVVVYNHVDVVYLLFTILLFCCCRFVRLCEDAYLILRRHASLFINMLAMMLQTGIPELRSIDDLNYVR